MIIIECDGDFENNGDILCNGDRGCSGGSILIIVKGKFVNNGCIKARDGGDKVNTVTNDEYFCDGSDGRIAVYLRDSKIDKQAVGKVQPAPYLGNCNNVSFEIMYE